MTQGDAGLNLWTKRTRKQEFLGRLTCVVPRAALPEQVAPFAPDSRRSRLASPRDVMLRSHFIRQWGMLRDPALEDGRHDVPLLREFARSNNRDTRLPDKTTGLQFRRLLERHKLAKRNLSPVNDLLCKGLIPCAGTVVDATPIAAPLCSNISRGKRGSEVRQATPGNQWYFGMKPRTQVSADLSPVHTVRCAAANAIGGVEGNRPPHDGEIQARRDPACRSALTQPKADTDAHLSVPMRPREHAVLSISKAVNQIVFRLKKIKACIQVKGEQLFCISGRQFGDVNATQVFMLFMLSPPCQPCNA